MVKKIKRFIVFVLFSFLYSLVGGKTASAAAEPKKNNAPCVFPVSDSGNILVNGLDSGIKPEYCE